MSREIKFRTWDKRTKKYRKSLDSVLDGGGTVYVVENGMLDILRRNPLVFEQYTGLKDKNGEVYEAIVANSNFKTVVDVGKKKEKK